MSPTIRKYYEAWIRGAKLFENLADERRFYQFAKACIAYGARSNLTEAWLREHLERDLYNGREKNEYTEVQIRKALTLFNAANVFHKTLFPNLELEGRDYRSRNRSLK